MVNVAHDNIDCYYNMAEDYSNDGLHDMHDNYVNVTWCYYKNE